MNPPSTPVRELSAAPGKQRKPATVYLDSSDYSFLSTDSGADSLSKLIKLKEHRVAKFIFSGITVSELIHTEKKHQHYAVGRANVLTKLCGKDCIFDMHRLLYLDCLAACGRNNSEFPEYAINSEGDWYPFRMNSFKEFRKECIEETQRLILEKIRNQMPYWDENFALKQVRRVIKNGRFTKEGSTLLNGFDKLLLEKFPFMNSKATSIFHSYMEGKKSHTELERIFKQLCFDPQTLVEKSIDSLDDGLSHFEWLRAGGDTLTSMIDAARAAFRIYRNDSVANEYDWELPGFRKRLLEQCWQEFFVEFCAAGVRLDEWEEKILNSDTPGLASLEAFKAAAELYFRTSVLDTRRKVLRSDTGDILHAYCIPYVDYFRADRHMSNVFESLAKKFNTVICPSLEYLLQRLNPAR